MYYNLTTAHLVTVIAYLLFHTFRVAYMLFTPQVAFNNLRQKTRVVEMVLSTLFVVTGFTLLLSKPLIIIPLFIVKLVLVFGCIPVAVIAFKRYIKWLAIVSWLMLIMAYGMAEMNKKMSRKVKGNEDITISADATKDQKFMAGQQLFEKNCINCHGADGKLGVSGAKYLSVSTLDSTARIMIITNGKNGMPAFGSNHALNAQQIEALSIYVRSLSH